MPFQGFEGPAGSGKTHRLMEAVEQRLQDHPLLPHQKILALTFMHGSRRRLDSEFNAKPQLRGKTIAMTIDSFAVQILSRWRTFAVSLGLEMGDFNQTCDASGRLLQHDAIARWVVRSYPIIVVDEAQELALPRLRMISALANHGVVFVAADEFQCLDEGIDTAPFMAWFAQGSITPLTHIHRTNKIGLLAAGASLRRLASPQPGVGFQVEYAFPNLAPFKIGTAIRSGNGTKAVLYPPGGGAWAEALTVRLAEGLRSTQYNIPPIHLAGEPRPADEIDRVLAAVGNVEGIETQEILSRISTIENPAKWLGRARTSVLGSANRLGKRHWTIEEFRTLLERTASNFRAYSIERPRGIALLPIHQAKNRQFDHVIIIWPPGVPGSDEFKARLLYNGITRARQSCKVFVRTQAILAEPPFFFETAEMAVGE